MVLLPSDEKPSFSVLRVFGALMSLGLGAVAVYCAVVSYRMAKDFDEWLVAEPVSSEIELSVAGRTEVPFVQTCQTAHGERVLLRIEDGSVDVSALLAGLEGTLEIVNSAGESVFKEDLKHRTKADESRADSPLVLAYFPPFRVGDYSLRLDVSRPAYAVAGHRQRLYANYLLCGLGKMPSVVAGAFALLTAGPALIIGIITSSGVARHGWRRVDSALNGRDDVPPP